MDGPSAQHWEALVRAYSRSIRPCLRGPYSRSAKHEPTTAVLRHAVYVARMPCTVCQLESADPLCMMSSHFVDSSPSGCSYRPLIRVYFRGMVDEPTARTRCSGGDHS